MAALVPAIHAEQFPPSEDMDARVEPGYDDTVEPSIEVRTIV
jgi:hypothetical protein